jgi:two-component system chemotaxis sensor kinase CheA
MSSPDDGFRREARSQCRALTNGLIELERGEADVEELFRVAHSLKGACRSVGLSGAGDIAHAVETLFEAVRAGRLNPDAALVDETIDAIAVLEAAVDADADENPATVAATLTDSITAQRDETAAGQRQTSTTEDSPQDVDDDVAAALDAASEFDDIDALLDEADDADDPADEAVDGWGMLGDEESSEAEASDVTGPAETADPTESATTDGEPDPTSVPNDPTAYFEQAKREETTPEGSTEDLQAEIESVSFGEFDDDDDVSIEELLALDPDDPAATEPESVADEGGTPDASEGVTTTDSLSTDHDPTQPADAASTVPEPTGVKAGDMDPEPEPAVTEVDDPEPEPAVTEVDDPEPEPAVTEVDDPEPEEEPVAPDESTATDELYAMIERLAEPVDESVAASMSDATEPASEPAPTTAEDDPVEVSTDDAMEPASAPDPTIDPEDGLFDGVTLPGTDEEATESTPSETTDSGAVDSSETTEVANALDDVTLPGTESTGPADDVAHPEAGTADTTEADDLDDLSDVELPDSDAPMDVRMDETLVEFEGDVEGLLDVDPDEVSMPGTAALTIEDSALDGDRFRPLGAGATPATVDTEQEPLTVAPDNAERLLNLAEELSLVEMRLSAAVGDVADDPVVEALAQLSSLVGEYQRTVMDVRLTPLASAVERLPAVARDAARTRDKQVRVETEGTDVRLDRSVVERLSDPLGHLVRNAVAHGIEPPAEREAAGKPETGTVTVSAERVRDEVVVEVHDDGAGVDVDAVRERAVEAGVVDADTAAALDKDAVLDLLFESGLSTADEVTEVAGRGVGMDAVAGAVRRVDGDVDVKTTPGNGTTVRLTLPVSVALTEVMLVSAGGQRFAVPLSAVEQVSPLPEPRVEDGRETVRRADLTWGSDPAGDADVERPYPLIRLSEAFDLAGDAAQLLWLRPEAGDAALGVEEVIGTREVVVRPYGEVFGPTTAVSGAATVGDGETVNVLDPGALAGGT